MLFRQIGFIIELIVCIARLIQSETARFEFEAGLCIDGLLLDRRFRNLPRQIIGVIFSVCAMLAATGMDSALLMPMAPCVARVKS